MNEHFFANDGKGWVVSTIRGKVAAIRFIHTCNYYPDPVAGNPRIKATFKALDKRAGEPAQVKLPATKEVVTSAMRRIMRCGLYSDKDKETVSSAMQSTWLFLPRSSEYCSGTSRSTTRRRGGSLFARHREP